MILIVVPLKFIVIHSPQEVKMKQIWLMLAFLVFTSVSYAQDHGKETCVTIEAMTNRLKSQNPKSYVYYTLRGFDAGFDEPSDLAIFTNDHDFIGAVFVKGCYYAYSVLTEEQVLELLNENTKSIKDEHGT